MDRPSFVTQVIGTSDNTLQVRLRPASAEEIRAWLGKPFWERVSEIEFEPGHEQGPGPTRIDIALDPAARGLLRLRGLRWADLSRLCKSQRTLALEHIGFEWGPGEHVLRRMAETTALPELRTLEIRTLGYSPEVGQLFGLLREQGRPLQRLILITGTRLGEPTNLTLEVRSEDGRVETIAELRESADEASAVLDAAGFGLPAPVRLSNGTLLAKRAGVRYIEHTVDYPVQGVAMFRSGQTELVLSDVYWRWLFDDLRRAAAELDDLASFVARWDEQDSELIATLPVTPPLVDFLGGADPSSADQFDRLVPSAGTSPPTAEQLQALIVAVFREALLGTIEIELG